MKLANTSLWIVLVTFKNSCEARSTLAPRTGSASMAPLKFQGLFELVLGLKGLRIQSLLLFTLPYHRSPWLRSYWRFCTGATSCVSTSCDVVGRQGLDVGGEVTRHISGSWTVDWCAGVVPLSLPFYRVLLRWPKRQFPQFVCYLRQLSYRRLQRHLVLWRHSLHVASQNDFLILIP